MPDHMLIDDLAGDRLFVKLDPGCETCLRQCTSASEIVTHCGSPTRRRRGKHNAALGVVFLCTDDSDEINSSKRFRTRIEIMGGAIQMLLDAKEKARVEGKSEANRITHNLRTLCSRVLLEIYGIASQEQLVNESDAASQKRVLRQEMLKDPEVTSATLLRILKNAQAMAHEFTVFERMDIGRVTTAQLMPHVLHRVVRNVVSSFYQDFQSKSISVRLSNNLTMVKLDYEIFSVAFYYVIENATKYCAHASDVNIRFDEGLFGLTLYLDMKSLSVDESEKETIFEEGYSGKLATLLKIGGKGIGMYLAKRALALGDVNIRFIPGIPLQRGISDARYAHNTIEMHFPKHLIVSNDTSPRTKRRLN